MPKATVDNDTLAQLFRTLGSAYAVAQHLGLDHSSTARRIRKLGLRGDPPKPEARKHFIIPDTQVKPGVDLDYLRWIGEYCVDQKPDAVVCLGDFADMPSLSSYDRGKKSFEGRRYKADIEAAKAGMAALMDPIVAGITAGGWQPEFHLTLGNHEHRIVRATEDSPELDGVLSLDDLGYEGFGWEVHPFLRPANIDGVMYCHYFTSGVMGRPITSASALLTKKHMSCIAGHQQGKQIAYAHKADGATITGMIIGSAYLHDEQFLGPQGNRHWRGIMVLHEVREGQFDEMPVSLNYLKNRYLRREAA